MNKKTEADAHFEQARIIRDSLSNKLHIKRIMDLEVQARLKEYESDRLFFKEKQQSQQKMIDTQRIFLWILMGLFLVFVLMISIFEYRKNSLQKIPKTRPDKDKNSAKTNDKVVTVKLKDISTPLPTLNDLNIDQVLKAEITRIFLEDKPYLEADFTLVKLASLLDSNTTYVSKTINAGFGVNFNTLINHYRIKELLILFENNEYQKFTIDALSKKVGFKSKSVFHQAFKKYTGETASAYIKQIQE